MIYFIVCLAIVDDRVCLSMYIVASEVVYLTQAVVILVLVIDNDIVVLAIVLSIGTLTLLIPDDWHVDYVGHILLGVHCVQLLVVGVKHVVVASVEGAGLVVELLLRSVLVLVEIIIILLLLLG